MPEQKPKINSLEIIGHPDFVPTKLTFSDRCNVILGNGDAGERRFIDIMRSHDRCPTHLLEPREDGTKDVTYPHWHGEFRFNVTQLSAIINVITRKNLGSKLYHEEISRIMHDELDDVQSFISTQDATVLDHLYFESPEEVQRSLILAESLVHEVDGPLVLRWRDPTEAEAEEFYGSYQVGIMQVSSILRLQGMW